MITPAEIGRKTMTPEKRASAHSDFFAFYIGRPISYVLTVPFLYTKLTPNQISLLSFIPQIAGLCLFYAAKGRGMLIAGWLMFFLWNLMDGVDGNVARYRKQFSRLGSVYDAMAGYMASALTFLAAGAAAAHLGGRVDAFWQGGDLYFLLGALSALFTMFPRLVMHKTITTLGKDADVKAVRDREHFSLIKVIALNLKSVTGGAQVLLLAAVLLDILDLYTICYCLFNLAVMLGALRSVLKE